MKTRIVQTQIPDNLDELATLYSQERHIDKDVLLSQWLRWGAEEWVLKLVEQGK